MFGDRGKDRQGEEEDRTVNAVTFHTAAAFPNNTVTNSKYTVLTFLPKNFYEQFGRPLNVYFLLIGLLQFIKVIAPVHPITTVGPLLFAFLLTACKEGLDDLQRHRQDRDFNDRAYSVVGSLTGELKRIPSREIRVGDIVRLESGDEIPCDLFLVSSSDDEGVAYIRTDNLDGEIDLKPRQAVDQIVRTNPKEEGQKWRGAVVCEKPNARLYHFNSKVVVAGGETVSVDSQQLLLQSCFLQNTDYAYGMAVYTGQQTKCSMNKRKTPVKIPSLDRAVTQCSLYVFTFQVAIGALLGGMGASARGAHEEDAWYLSYDAPEWYTPLIIPTRFFLLTSVMIPISFKVIIDISKYYISLAIGWDLEMYDGEVDKEQGGCPARANSTAIAEDLGQIEFVMTDKTGTLTENVMEFRCASVGGAMWGGGGGKKVDPSVGALSDRAFQRALSSGDAALNLFARHLALCHTVSLKDEGGYSAASPDEEALVRAAHKMGSVLKGRTKRDVTIAHNGGGDEAFSIVHTFEFTSDRKMMSILLRSKSGELTLFTKGADSSVLPLLSREAAAERSAAEAHIDAFAAAGLRTLVVAQRGVKREELDKWLPALQTAMTQTGDSRAAKLAETYKLLERDMTFVGVTAIEDRLQEEVPETISALRKANIRFWMLTGDKYETAKQIARSCNLWKAGEHLHPIRQSDSLTALQSLRQVLNELPDLGAQAHLHNRAHRSSLERGLMDGDQEMSEAAHSESASQRASQGNCLIIEGGALEDILDAGEEAQDDLREAGVRCSTVICCRVTPAQKAKVTRLVKGTDRGPKDWKETLKRFLVGGEPTRVLSIGDGGNDVAMIQEATIGVGIVGKEGRQASRAADYSIAKFRFLKTLLLVHGHYSYSRSAYITQYCFYKSMLVAWIQMQFNMHAGLSGISFWNSFHLMCWNGVFTLPGPFLYGLDRIAPRSSLMSNPTLYHECQEGRYLTRFTFMGVHLGRGLVQAVVMLWITLIVAGGESMSSDGQALGFRAVSSVTYTAMLFMQSWVLLLDSNTLTVWNIASIVLMPVLYLIATAIYSELTFLEYYKIFSRVAGDGTLFLLIVLLTVLPMLPHHLAVASRFNLCPNPTDRERIREVLFGGGVDEVVGSPLSSSEPIPAASPASPPSGPSAPATSQRRLPSEASPGSLVGTNAKRPSLLSLGSTSL
eukprot:Hpha_TRINITY_DN15865_c2_g1::TRINITY_DN15865_c2_g1_i1::g.188318::m.188318/K01530/E3.6.3.1; phospholipid-translocating ATPase